MKRLATLLMLFAALALTGCVTSGGSNSAGRGKVQIVDAKTRIHNTTTLDHADFLQFAENITNKMLSSNFAASWGDKRPRFVVATTKNDTKNDSIRPQEITERIQEVLMNSGLVRIMDRSSLKFDYLLVPRLTSEEEVDPESNEKIVTYVMVLKVTKIDGEIVGHWSDSLKMVKAGRSIF